MHVSGHGMVEWVPSHRHPCVNGTLSTQTQTKNIKCRGRQSVTGSLWQGWNVPRLSYILNSPGPLGVPSQLASAATLRYTKQAEMSGREDIYKNAWSSATQRCTTYARNPIPIHTNPCQSIPIHTNPYQPIPIHTNPYQSIPIRTNLYQSIPTHTNLYHSCPCS